MTERIDLDRLRERIHDVLVVLLVGLRPSITDGSSAALPTLIWYGLLAAALGVCAVEGWSGRGRRLGWGPAGIAATITVALMLPAAWRGPAGYEAWALLGQWSGHLALAVYLALVLPDRARLMLAAVIASAAVQIAYGLGQAQWALPSLAEEARAGTVPLAGVSTADFLERIDRGGVFGAFILANAFAAFLVLALALMAGALRQRGRMVARLGLACCLLLGCIVLVLTRSKGACVAAAGAGLVVMLIHARPRWRLAAIAAAVVALITVIALPGLRDGLAASADVRLDYWRAALALIGLAPFSGHGIGGYAAQASAHLPIGAEYSKYVHNEILEACVAGGVFAGLALCVWLICLARKPASLPETGNTRHPLLLMLPLALTVPYLHAFGLLSFPGWPGAQDGLHLFAALGLGLVGGAALWAANQMVIPAWALHLGLLGVMLHLGIDFDLHAGGVVAALTACAVVAGGTPSRALSPRLSAGIASGTCLAIVLALATFGPRGRALVTSADAVTDIMALPTLAQTDPERCLRVAEALHQNHGLSLPQRPLRTGDFTTLFTTVIEQAWTVANARPPASPDHRIMLLRLMPAGAARLDRSRAFVAEVPWMARAHRCLAEDLAASGDLAGAIAATRLAMTRAPWHLPHRQALADLLERNGDHDAAAAERATVADLANQVYFRDRPLETP